MNVNSKKLKCKVVFTPSQSDVITFSYNEDKIRSHHLCFVSERQIKPGDWFYTVSKQVLLCEKVLHDRIISTDNKEFTAIGCLKVEATTDYDINLPKINSTFTEAFQRQGSIELVYLELETHLRETS